MFVDFTSVCVRLHLNHTCGMHVYCVNGLISAVRNRKKYIGADVNSSYKEKKRFFMDVRSLKELLAAGVNKISVSLTDTDSHTLTCEVALCCRSQCEQAEETPCKITAGKKTYTFLKYQEILHKVLLWESMIIFSVYKLSSKKI